MSTALKSIWRVLVCMCLAISGVKACAILLTVDPLVAIVIGGAVAHYILTVLDRWFA